MGSFGYGRRRGKLSSTLAPRRTTPGMRNGYRPAGTIGNNGAKLPPKSSAQIARDDLAVRSFNGGRPRVANNLPRKQYSPMTVTDNARRSGRYLPQSFSGSAKSYGFNTTGHRARNVPRKRYATASVRDLPDLLKPRRRKRYGGRGRRVSGVDYVS